MLIFPVLNQNLARARETFLLLLFFFDTDGVQIKMWSLWRYARWKLEDKKAGGKNK